MASAVVMPKVGQAVESCVLSEWCKKEGEAVRAGEVLFRFETDKSIFDEEAKESGVLLGVFFEEGDDIPCLTIIGAIGAVGENIDDLRPQTASDEVAAESATDIAQKETLQSEKMSVPISSATPGQQVFISPRAKQLAEKHGVSYDAAIPTGPDGRIVEEDILRLVAVGATATKSARAIGAKADAPGTGIGGRVTVSDAVVPVEAQSDYTDSKLSTVRKVTAKAMTHSLSSMAQLTHTSSFDASTLLSMRRMFKDAGGENRNITINDMILFAVSRVLLHHPDLNANLMDDTIRHFRHVNLGIAVDTPRGLLVPTLFNADQMSLAEISNQSKLLIEACRQGSIMPDQMKGGSFTVSNLGAFGIEHFTPIVNPPQTGILGVNCTVDRVRKVDGEIVVYPAMGLSLTYDHRALDGAPASRFLQELCKTLENFCAILF